MLNNTNARNPNKEIRKIYLISPIPFVGILSKDKGENLIF